MVMIEVPTSSGQGSRLTDMDNYPASSFFFFFFLWLLCVACGILVLPPGIEPEPLVSERHGLNHWTAREVPQIVHY